MTPCAWAACHRPAVATVEGWPMCGPCRTLHYQLEHHPQTFAEKIAELHAAGMNDHQIAAELDRNVWAVKRARQRIGLVGHKNVKRSEHGSPARARQHYRDGEPLCRECRQSEQRRKADRASARRGPQTAGSWQTGEAAGSRRTTSGEAPRREAAS